MREFKFRAWNKTRNTMFIQGVHFNDLCVVNGVLKPSLNIMVGNNSNWYKEEYELMQYVGFKDGNCKEIYEGDIVEIKYKEYAPDGETIIERYVKGYIKYNYFGFDICTGQINGVDCYSEFIQVSMLCDRIMDEEWEVIGNIYQNPNLLK